jgi:hypothetical protein
MEPVRELASKKRTGTSTGLMKSPVAVVDAEWDELYNVI